MPQTNRPLRKALAGVTMAGVFLLILSIYSIFEPTSLMRTYLRSGDTPRITAPITEVPIPLFFQLLFPLYAIGGVAMVRRWRGWRIYAGLAAWLIIVLFVLGLLHFILNEGWRYIDAFELIFGIVRASIVGALATFILWAKRREPSNRAEGVAQ